MSRFLIAPILLAFVVSTNVAHAQTAPVWATAMTVGEIDDYPEHGYDSYAGALDDDDFQYASTTYTVELVRVDPDVVVFRVDRFGLPEDDILTLVIDGHEFPFADTDYADGDEWGWETPADLDDPVDDLPVGDRVVVCLRTATQVCPTSVTGLPPGLSVADVSAEEGEDLTFTVTLSAVSAETVTAAWATSGGTATSGTDFTAGTGTLAFTPGVRLRTFTVSTTEDTTDEDHETFTVTLSNATNATFWGATATGTIRNDDAPPLAWSTTMTVGRGITDSHGYSARDPDDVVGSLSDADFEYKSTTFTVTNLSAHTVSGVLLIVDKEGLPLERDLTLEIDGDEFPFENRNFASTETSWAWDPASYPPNLATAPVGSTVLVCLRTEGQVCPTPTPMLSVADVSAEEGDDLTFTARLSVPSTQMVTVDWATSGGTATSGTDFTAGTGTLAFAPGARERTFTVSTTEDMTVEDDETFTVTLSNATVGISVATATGTIENDDYPPWAWSTTLTVGNFRDALFGYRPGTGSLTETGFEFRSATYAVSDVGVFISRGVTYVRLSVNRAGLPLDDTLTLEIAGHEFPFDERVRATGTLWLWNAPEALHDPATNFPVDSTATVCLRTEGEECPDGDQPTVGFEKESEIVLESVRNYQFRGRARQGEHRADHGGLGDPRR